MNEQDKQDNLITLMADLKEDAVMEMVRHQIADGVDPMRIIEFCHKAMTKVGERYEQGIYFISGLIMAGEIMHQVGRLVLPLLETKVSNGDAGRIVLGTVEGDIHFIGKDIFKVLIRCHGFAVHDLGEDVPPSRFLAAVNDVKPDIVGLSCLISTAFGSLQETISLLRDNMPSMDPPPTFIIGGLLDEQICQYAGSDYWTNDAMEGVRLCQQIMEERKQVVHGES